MGGVKYNGGDTQWREHKQQAGMGDSRRAEEGKPVIYKNKLSPYTNKRDTVNRINTGRFQLPPQIAHEHPEYTITYICYNKVP